MALKGHAKIELTNVNTGEVEVIEHENMITNGILKVINKRGLLQSPVQVETCVNAAGSSICHNWFKGLFIFDSPLNNNPDDFSIPSNISCVGYGNDAANNGINSLLGSYNQTESETAVTDGQVKYVWDFATNQANGTISSLALVPFEVAKMGWENKREEYVEDVNSVKNFTIEDTEAAVDADCYLYYDDAYIWGIERNNICYDSSNASNWIYNSGKLRFIKRKFMCLSKKASIFGRDKTWSSKIDGIIEVELPDEMKSVMSSISSSSTTYLYLYTHIEYDSGYIYFYLNEASTVAVDSTFYLLKINADDFSSELLTITNTTNHVLSIGSLSYVSNESYYCAYSSNSRMRIVGENLIVSGSDGWWIIDLKDNTKVREVTFSNGESVTNAPTTGLKYKNYLFIGTTSTSSTTSPGGLYVINIEKGLAFNLYCSSTKNPFVLRYYYSYSSNRTYHYLHCFVTSRTDDEMPHMFIFMDSDSSWGIKKCLNPLILMTKNNLDTPVVKTSAQTMKVVYTLTEVDDE